MITYDKVRIKQQDGVKYKVYAVDGTGYINGHGVAIYHVVGDEIVLLRYNNFYSNESGSYTIMDKNTWNELADNYNPYRDLDTWTLPFLRYIGKWND